MPFVIGLDLGTASCKAVLHSETGSIVTIASSACDVRAPRTGWTEQVADEVWQAAVSALSAVARSAAGRTVAGLCLSGAMHSLLPVNAQGVPLAPAMTWADQRAVELTAALRQSCDAHELYQRTGCPLRGTYHAARLRWWAQNPPDVRPAKFVAIKDLVLHRLIGSWVTDTSIASTTGLLDMQSGVWDPEALSLAGVHAAALPALVAPEAVVGGLTAEAARATGLPAGLPVVAGASDGGLANWGVGALDPQEVVVTVGTSGAVRRIEAAPRLDPLERTWCYRLLAGQWFSGGAINNGGLALQWLRRTLYRELSDAEGFARIFEDAATVPVGSAGLFFLPYLTGERSPYWDLPPGGLCYGLTIQHDRAHVARAVLEGVAFCLADVWQALSIGVARCRSARLTGGIVRSHVWRQIVADVLGVPLLVTEAADASAVGAAWLGHLALGHIESLEGAARAGEASVVVEPDPARHETYLSLHQRFQQLYGCLSSV